MTWVGPSLATGQSAQAEWPRGAVIAGTRLDRATPGPLCWAVLALALLLGGGTRNFLLSDLLVQFAAVGALAYGLFRLRWQLLQPEVRRLVVLLLLVVAIPLIQVVPVPAALVGWLPGRAEVYSGLDSLGVPAPAFRTWSLDPNATLASVRSLLPAAALLVLAVQIDPKWRSRMVGLVMSAAVLMVALGVAQVAQGSGSGLRFYTPTNAHEAVGLYANRNHYASFLVVALICVFGGVIRHGTARTPPNQRALHMLGWLLMSAILMLGVFLARSRSAVGLAAVMSAIMLILAFISGKQLRGATRWLPIIVIAAGLVAVEFGLDRIAARFGNLEGGQRTDVLPHVLELTRRFAASGTGVGSFPAVYEAYAPVADLGPKIVNHAHNDWAEIWIDVGLPALLVLGLFARWVWQRLQELRVDWGNGQRENAERLVGALILLSLCLHSLLDYPLRTTSLSCVFVLACILMLRTRRGGDGRRDLGSAS